MGEQPIYSSKAHVFHIDPQTKRSWIPASCQAVNVSFFYDSARNLYRIISVEGSKAVINSTITPNMTFTKTSQKFGQWSDIRANTVYGLGFSTEHELNKFIEKFHEVKEATRTAAQQAKAQNGTIMSGSSTCPGRASRHGSRDHSHSQEESSAHLLIDQMGLIPAAMTGDLNCHGGKSLHQRSQSLSGLQVNKALTDSPKHLHKDKLGSSVIFPQSSTEAQLRYENDRLKLALAQSSANAKKWEVELLTLKNNNARLTSALQESTANVEEWKRQLQILKDENSKMRMKILELEASSGNHEAIGEIRKEINILRTRAETLEIEVRQKDKEVEIYKQRFESSDHIYNSSIPVDDKLKALLEENEALRTQLIRITDGSESKRSERVPASLLETLNGRLARNIQELRSIQQEFTSLLNS